MTTTQNPPFGLQPETNDMLAVNHGAAAIVRGQMMNLDMTIAGTGTVQGTVGAENSQWASVDDGLAAEGLHGVICVALQDLAVGAQGRFRIKGVVTALVGSIAGATITSGTPLYADEEIFLQEDDASAITLPQRVIAKFMDVDLIVAATVSGLRIVWLEGVNGFGTTQAT